MDQPASPPASLTTPATAPRQRKPRVWHLFALLVLSQVLLMVIVTVVVATLAFSRGQIDGQTPPAQVNRAVADLFRSHQIGFVGLAVNAGLGVALALLIGWRSPARFAQRLRLGAGRLTAVEVAVATLGFVAFSWGFDELQRYLPGYDQSSIHYLRDMVRDRAVASLPVMVAMLALAVPLSEELVYRGALQTRFAERFGGRLGLVIASLCFGIAHMDPLHGLFAFFAGLYLGWVCDLATSLRAPFVMHAVNNLAAVVGATSLPEADEQSPSWWVMGVSLALSAVCIRWLWRRTRERLRPDVESPASSTPEIVTPPVPADAN